MAWLVCDLEGTACLLHKIYRHHSDAVEAAEGLDAAHVVNVILPEDNDDTPSERAVKRLVNKASRLGLEAEDFNRIVQRACRHWGDQINQAGLDEQIRWLIKRWGWWETKEVVKRLLRRYPHEQHMTW
jgi:hypothetical protein